jgi:acyl dehydratase
MNVEVGTTIGSVTAALSRTDLVRYAGASGDFNPIHYNDAAAAALGLPGVIAHGMLTMGTALRVVTDWIGDPNRVLSYYVRSPSPSSCPLPARWRSPSPARSLRSATRWPR